MRNPPFVSMLMTSKPHSAVSMVPPLGHPHRQHVKCGATVKSVRGEQHYCGLVRVSSEGGQQQVKLLKIEDLVNNGEYSEVAGLMEKLSSVNTYPYVPPPADEVMFQDFEAMNSQPDIDDYPGLFIDAKLRGCPKEIEQ